MQDKRKTKDQLIDELLDLRVRVAHWQAQQSQPPAGSTGRDGQFDPRALLESMADRLWAVDRQYCLLWGNTAFQQVSRAAIGRELAPGDLVLIEPLLAETCDVWRGYYDRALCGEKFGIEYTTHFTPQPRVIDYQFSPLFDNERVIGVAVSGRDITERKRAEGDVRRLNFELERHVTDRTRELEAANAALRDDIHQRQRIEELLHRSEQRYRTLFENAGDAIFIVDLSGQIIEVNHMASQQLGYTRDELKGRSLSTFDASPEVASVDERIRRLRQTGEQVFEAVHRRRDGSLVPVEIKSSVVEYAGSPAVLGIARDVTERKRAEHVLRRYADEQTALYNTALLLSAQLDVSELLRLTVERATGLLGVTAGGVYLYDDRRQALVLAVGQAYYADYVGVELKPGEGLCGQAFQRRTVMRLDDYHTWEAQAAAYRHESRIHSVVAAPLLGRYAPLGVLFVASDQCGRQFDDRQARLVELITAEAAIALENAQLYEQQQEHFRYLQESQARLIQLEKMSALGRLVASIAHEINNPLQAVQGCLTLVRESVEGHPQLDTDQATGVLRDLDVAASEVTRVAGMVQRLRDFYRPTRAGMQLADVNALVETVLALTAKQLQHSRIELDRALTTHPLPIMTNADQIKQVCLNLILNAIDAMPQRGRLRVATRLTKTPNDDTPADGRAARPMVCIDFADTGSGISPDVLPQIFEPFFTTKETGSGLGLSISYEIVKALGGEITVTSELGRGSTFTVWLPVEADAARLPSEVKHND